MDRLKISYKIISGVYDRIMVSGRRSDRFYRDLIWGKVNEAEIISGLLEEIPESFRGKILDVPAGTLALTGEKYSKLYHSDITALDYSDAMLQYARKRICEAGIGNIRFIVGDVGNMPFDSATYDCVVCLNGLHVFPDKRKAYSEIARVLKPGGRFIACNYVRGERIVSDMVAWLCGAAGWISLPCDNAEETKRRLVTDFEISRFSVDGSYMSFVAIRK